MHDLIRGEIRVNTSTLDDKVLFKSADMLPTYHLANIVDDYLMEISCYQGRRMASLTPPARTALQIRLDRQDAFAHLPYC